MKVETKRFEVFFQVDFFCLFEPHAMLSLIAEVRNTIVTVTKVPRSVCTKQREQEEYPRKFQVFEKQNYRSFHGVSWRSISSKEAW